ncbi:MAG TPA: hypothetical protein VNQ79_20540 [Blastocatellia bacterium]|nr:hypothetical protein [Blastocatellia bacterium]
MKLKRGSATNRIIVTLLCVLLNAPFSYAGKGAQTLREAAARKAGAKPQGPKLAPDLEELLARDDEQKEAKQSGPKTLAERRAGKLAKRVVAGGAVLPSEAVAAEERQSFIVQMSDTATSAAMQATLAGYGGRVSRKLDGLGLVMIEAPRTAVRQLAADGQIAYLSPASPGVCTGPSGTHDRG